MTKQADNSSQKLRRTRKHKQAKHTPFPSVTTHRSKIELLLNIIEPSQKETQTNSEESFQLLFAMWDAIPEAIVFLDSQNKLLGYNQAWELLLLPILRDPLSIFIGKIDYITLHRIFFGRKAQAQLLDFFSRFENSQKAETVELEFHLPSTTYWFKLTINQVTTAFGNFRIITHNNITQFKQLLQTQRSNEDYFRTLFENTFDVISLVNESGQIFYQSPSIEILLGYQASYFIGHSYFDFLHPDDTKPARNSFQKILQYPKKHQHFEFRFRHIDGSWRILECQTRNLLKQPLIEAIVFNARDITRRKEVENRLRISEQNNQAVLRAIPDLMFRIHKDGTVLALKEGTPFSQEKKKSAAQDKHLIGSTHDLLQLIKHYAERALKKQKHYVIECLLTLDEKRYDYEVRIAISGKDEVLAIVRDITENNKLQARLFFSDRIAVLGTLAASIGHEINNPLTYILSNLDELLEQFQSNHNLAKATVPTQWIALLQETKEGAERVREIAKDLKTYSRSNEGATETLSPHEAIESALQIASNELRHRTQILKKYNKTPYIRGNKSRLEQVFLNILMNATEALPEGQSLNNQLTISTHHHPSEKRVEVVIKDNGPGISKHILPRIFEPFFTSKPLGKGTGLGLFVCHNIIKKMGGEIKAESVLGKGATFRISLPTAKKKETAPELSSITRKLVKTYQPPPEIHPKLKPQPIKEKSLFIPEPLELPPLTIETIGKSKEQNQIDRKLTILIIDDEPRVARSLKRILRNHDVKMVNDGQEAFEMMRKTDFDLIFCDLLMPGWTGIDVFEVVQKQLPGMEKKMIFMTGGAFTPRASKFLQDRSDDFLEKPFNSKMIRDLVKKKIAQT